MTTATVERQELHQAVDALPEGSVLSALHLIRNLQLDNDDDFYNPVNLRRLDHSIEQLKQGKVIIKTIEELEKMADE